MRGDTRPEGSNPSRTSGWAGSGGDHRLSTTNRNDPTIVTAGYPIVPRGVHEPVRPRILGAVHDAGRMQQFEALKGRHEECRRSMSLGAPCLAGSDERLRLTRCANTRRFRLASRPE